MWPTATAPTGYLLCAGAAVSRTTYATLFAVISTTFGVGDGTTTFNLPNYTNRMPYGTTLGATGGSADAVVVSHTHTATSTSTVTDPGHQHGAGSFIGLNSPGGNGFPSGSNGALSATPSATTGITVATSTTNTATGVSGTNANLPPYLGINFIIKV
jgi:microcystin-dependent protein